MSLKRAQLSTGIAQFGDNSLFCSVLHPKGTKKACWSSAFWFSLFLWTTYVESHPHPVKNVDNCGCIPLYGLYKYSKHWYFALHYQFIGFGGRIYPHKRLHSRASGAGRVDKCPFVWMFASLIHTHIICLFGWPNAQTVVFHTFHGTTASTSTLR